MINEHRPLVNGTGLPSLVLFVIILPTNYPKFDDVDGGCRLRVAIVVARQARLRSECRPKG